MAELSDFLNSINTTKENIMRDNLEAPTFPGFIVNRLLSYHEDVILIINELNQRRDLDPQLQYEFLLHFLPKKKRFSKLEKGVVDKKIDLVKKYHKCSYIKAVELAELYNQEEIEEMEKELFVGGIVKA